MAIVWLIYVLFLLIFFVIGWTAIFYAEKYSIPGDFTKKAAAIYIVVMLFIVFVTVAVVLKNGANAPLNLPDIHFNISK